MSRITHDIETMLGIEGRPKDAASYRNECSVTRNLRRHPVPVVARFRHSLVLTYAFPKSVLEPLLPPGLLLDAHGDWGFAAVAMVQTEGLRPAFFPKFLGQKFFLTGYRIFARYRTREGRLLRGLRILRSDTDRKLMMRAGNWLTHYNYQHAQVTVREEGMNLGIEVQTPGGVADLAVTADLESRPSTPPEGSPFSDWHTARLFAGPLPFTFDYESSTHSVVLIEGVRRHWNPRPVAVNVLHASFFDRAPFNRVRPVLANAFYVSGIDYRWNRGVVEPLETTTPANAAAFAFA